MKEIMFIGQLVNPSCKEIILELRKHFQVQIFNGNTSAFNNIVDISMPDLVFVNLAGLPSHNKELLSHIKVAYPQLHVLTAGTQYEQLSYLELYNSHQFENITMPTSAAVIVAKCKLALGEEAEIEEVIAMPEELSMGDGTKKFILAIDDNALFLRNLKSILDTKYDVALAVSGAQALKLLEKKRPDLILLDYEMPQVNGKQIMEGLKSISSFSDVPIVMLTSVTNNEKIVEIMKLRPSGYILKPPNKYVLFSKIEELIGQ